MADGRVKITRVKMRFKTGEEFEAEGDSGFISRQKDEFLNLIGKAQTQPLARPVWRPATAQPELFETAHQPVAPAYPAPSYPSQAAYEAPENFTLPKHLRGPVPSSQETLPATQAPAVINAPAVWNNVCAAEGDLVIIRRKFKLLTPPLAALTLLAAAKILLGQNYYSSLKLAKSMKISGFMEDRLDRILTSEIRQGTVVFEGEKRNRVYKITDEGFARAFVLAEKLN
ncbi:MAG: hypothetical protein LBI01_03665 [Elusimicrobium sp.]|jgi:hypothetical protein|nr:hypothetical protein [Elusimicrobium sp.]